MSQAERSPCPACGAPPGALTLEPRLVAEPIGDWSLAGAQVKTSARARPVLCCAACGLHAVGEYDGDGRHATFRQEAPDG